MTTSGVSGDESKVPARKIELLIEQRIFGRCTHPSFEIREGREGKYLHAEIVCTSCSARTGHPRGLVSLHHGDYVDNPTANPWAGWTNDQLLTILRGSTIAPHSLDIVTTRIVLRELEKKGWSWSYASRDGLMSYTLSKNGRKVGGAPAREEHIAIANALGELVTSPSPI